MIRALARAAAVAAAAALLVAGTGTAASAEDPQDVLTWQGLPEVDLGELVPPVEITMESPAQTVERALAGTGASCQIAVDGRMVAPGVVAAGTAAQALVDAVVTCRTDTGAAYTISGRVTDYYLYSGTWRAGTSYYASAASVAGAAAIAPGGVAGYSPTGRAANAWHRVQFTGSLLGRSVTITSQLYYLAAV